MRISDFQFDKKKASNCIKAILGGAFQFDIGKLFQLLQNNTARGIKDILGEDFQLLH